MIPSAQDLCDDDFLFQQELASSHTSKSTTKWLKEKDITLFPWPANSPDLNPTENLWGIILCCRVKANCPLVGPGPVENYEKTTSRSCA